MKTTTPPERDWLLAGSRPLNARACIPSPPGPISGPIERDHGPDHLLRDYRNESEWSRRIETEAWMHDLFADIPEEEE